MAWKWARPADEVLDRFRAMDFDLETDRRGRDTVGAAVTRPPAQASAKSFATV
ncbi:hypothetical protein OG389_33800 [Streptomyces sp. NBC_00435]|uniref:hypothetical protein n=1 Tax=Streptomyces sp. NBC_00435 TaxID=2903649 RepID=UPI002E20C18E